MQASNIWAAAILAGAAAATTSCVDNESSMTVEAVLAPTPPSCVAVADPGSTQLLRGTLDVAFSRTYQALILIGNQLTARGAKQTLRTETQGISLEGAEVRVTDARGRLLDEYSVNIGGFIQANTGNAAGYGLASVAMIPPNVGDEMYDRFEERVGASQTLVSNVKVYGATLGGVEITSSEFTFPIEVCYGCLVQFPLAAVTSLGGQRVCGDATQAVDVGGPCNFGQDEYIDCRLCASTENVCAVLPE